MILIRKIKINNGYAIKSVLLLCTTFVAGNWRFRMRVYRYENDYLSPGGTPAHSFAATPRHGLHIRVGRFTR